MNSSKENSKGGYYQNKAMEKQCHFNSIFFIFSLFQIYFYRVKSIQYKNCSSMGPCHTTTTYTLTVTHTHTLTWHLHSQVKSSQNIFIAMQSEFLYNNCPIISTNKCRYISVWHVARKQINTTKDTWPSDQLPGLGTRFRRQTPVTHLAIQQQMKSTSVGFPNGQQWPGPKQGPRWQI